MNRSNGLPLSLPRMCNLTFFHQIFRPILFYLPQNLAFKVALYQRLIAFQGRFAFVIGNLYFFLLVPISWSTVTHDFSLFVFFLAKDYHLYWFAKLRFGVKWNLQNSIRNLFIDDSPTAEALDKTFDVIYF